jgi:hypothetical protein
MHTQEFRRILTHNPKGLPIVFLYSLLDGCNTQPSTIQRFVQGICFRLPSCFEFRIELYLKDRTLCLHR